MRRKSAQVGIEKTKHVQRFGATVQKDEPMKEVERRREEKRYGRAKKENQKNGNKKEREKQRKTNEKERKMKQLRELWTNKERKKQTNKQR